MSEDRNEELPPGVMRCKGRNGTVTFDGTWVVIDRSKGFFARTTVGKGEKRIAVNQITSVRWKKPGSMMVGYISFSLPGGVETRSGFGSQTYDAAKDENAVLVERKHTDEFLALKEKIEEAIAQRGAPQTSPAPAPPDDPAEALKKLGELHDSGLLTDEEFATKRAAIVDRL